MKKAVILFNLGGPDKLENVEPLVATVEYKPSKSERPGTYIFYGYVSY